MEVKTNFGTDMKNETVPAGDVLEATARDRLQAKRNEVAIKRIECILADQNKAALIVAAFEDELAMVKADISRGGDGSCVPSAGGKR